MPNYKVVYGKLKVEAAVFVLEQMVDERTGLHLTMEVDLVDEVLKELWERLFEMKERGARMRLDNLEKSDEQEWGDNEEEEESAEQKLLKNIMRVTQDVINYLVQRRSLTWRDMKKRAKRKYLKELKVNDGPYVSTLALVTQISIMIGGPEAVQEKILGHTRMLGGLKVLLIHRLLIWLKLHRAKKRLRVLMRMIPNQMRAVLTKVLQIQKNFPRQKIPKVKCDGKAKGYFKN